MIKAFIHPTETCPKCGLSVFFYPLNDGLKCWNPDCRMNQDELDDVDKRMIPGAWAAYNKLVEEGKISRNTPYQGIATNEIVQPGAAERAK